ncbi:MAG: MotA/TolQ/ExbB proton channel family protein [Alphaproteobacteria bacterium]
MDLATILGLLGGFALVATAMVLGGSATAFVDLPSIMIVIGGTACVTMICFSVDDVVRAQSVIGRVIFRRLNDPTAAARRVLQLADRARRDGVLGLQPMLTALRDEPFLYRALSLVVDGTKAEDIEHLLGQEVTATGQRDRQSASVYRKAAEVAPAMGLIGTLVGLVQMLGNLDDPDNIGPSMAVALLTTFYGAILANMVFAPLATKLERRTDEDQLIKNLYLIGATSIGRQENPRRLEMLLNTVLPPTQQVRYFD